MAARAKHGFGNPSPVRIISTYLDGLRTKPTGPVSAVSVLLFFGAPVVTGVLLYTFVPANQDMNWGYQALSIFSIFLGLLMSAQMSLFSIRNRLRVAGREEFQMEDDEVRFALGELKRMNSLISYLNIVSVVAIAASIVLVVTKTATILQESVIVGFYAHFLLNSLVLLRTAHILFQKGFN